MWRLYRKFYNREVKVAPLPLEGDGTHARTPFPRRRAYYPPLLSGLRERFFRLSQFTRLVAIASSILISIGVIVGIVLGFVPLSGDRSGSSTSPFQSNVLDLGHTHCVESPAQQNITCVNLPTSLDSFSEILPPALPFFGQLFVHGVELEQVSPLSWVQAETMLTSVFSRWAVQRGKCLAIKWEESIDPSVISIDCQSSYDILIFERSGLGVTLRSMFDADLCVTARGDGSVVLSQCLGSVSQQFEYKQYAGGRLSIQAAGSAECLVPDWAVVAGQLHVPVSARVRLGRCDHISFGLIERDDQREMALHLGPQVVGTRAFRLGQAYMGNPGVQLPWDAVPSHLVSYPWAADFCAAPMPSHLDVNAACSESTDASVHETYQCGINQTDGRNCSGFCNAATLHTPCSCGTISCPGCMLGLGFDAMTSEFLPEGCIYVGCQDDADLDPATEGVAYHPLLIPGGLNIRTCPHNVLDGMRPWTEIAQANSSTCQSGDACANESHVGTMSLSGHHVTVCCPGEAHDPFSAHSLGYFGVIPVNAHYGNDGSRDGVVCDATGCTYTPQCACPLSVPALNIRVTGPPTDLGTIHVPAGDAYRENDSQNADLVISPQLRGDSSFQAYSVFIGSFDSLHVGDDVALNSPGIFNFIEQCKASSSCHNRSRCSNTMMGYYPGFGGPKEINPSGKWNVKARSKSILDDRTIRISPLVINGTLEMGAVFIGHPGKTRIGENPDLKGIFQGLTGRPTSGPGSSPGGTTSIGIEKLKAFFRCKDSIRSGTEYDDGIFYRQFPNSSFSSQADEIRE